MTSISRSFFFGVSYDDEGSESSLNRPTTKVLKGPPGYSDTARLCRIHSDNNSRTFSSADRSSWYRIESV